MPAFEARPSDAGTTRVLFVCTGASCRSQMAAGWARELGGEGVEAFAAGIDPKGLDPRAVACMQEVGIDISRSPSESVYGFLETGAADVVIAVCSEAGRNCPEFPSSVPVLRWSFEDPAAAEGTLSEREEVFRCVRDEIRVAVSRWLVTELGIRPFRPRSSERTT